MQSQGPYELVLLSIFDTCPWGQHTGACSPPGKVEVQVAFFHQKAVGQQQGLAIVLQPGDIQAGVALAYQEAKLELHGHREKFWRTPLPAIRFC
jgi:hypothetical protein